MIIKFLNSKDKKLIRTEEYALCPPMALDDSVKLAGLRYVIEGIEWNISDPLTAEVYLRKI